ncbi:hypothetical protein [Methylobacterium sp. E-066]|uniref:hypothetical protein n=1 Tax=Methylobacterium sp. E-066 TaxID=2836584 RepID=UPI001FB8D204|nr:hypothetical protein [Methylobacterium sp. E-066]MCJ2140260.1 hypothetical protein [Methylobacterium sp. E-066]
MTPTKVENDEFLYRSIRANPSEPEEYSYASGKLIISVSAFNDRGNKPSVDRSLLRDKPEEAKKNSSDGVAALLAEDVRNIKGVKVTAERTDERTYYVDAIHRPLLADPVNLAHCQVECDPELANPSRFRKIKEALAIIATKHGFVIDPAESAASASSAPTQSDVVRTEIGGEAR